MGITISSKRHSCKMSYGGFSKFRNLVAEKINEKIQKHYLCLSEPELMFLSGKKRDEFIKKYNTKTEELIKQGEMTKEVANFLYQPASKGKIDENQAKEIYELIKNCDDDMVFGHIVFGHIGRGECAKMSDLKKIFSDETKIKWR